MSKLFAIDLKQALPLAIAGKDEHHQRVVQAAQNAAQLAPESTLPIAGVGYPVTTLTYISLPQPAQHFGSWDA